MINIFGLGVTKVKDMKAGIKIQILHEMHHS